MSLTDSQPQAVLLIDDDAISRELLTLLLDAEGFSVSVSASGALALEHLRELRDLGVLPAIILADVQMPGIAGVELAAALRAACPGAVLLSMSASKPRPVVVAAYDGFLIKPFSIRQFLAEVSRTESAVLSIAPVDADATGLGGEYTHSEDEILDPAIRAKFSAAMSAQQLKELYAFCLSDARERIRRMRLLASQGDAEGVRKEAHAIRGSCSMLGASEIARIAAGLEEFASRSCSPAEMEDAIQKLMVACERLACIL